MGVQRLRCVAVGDGAVGKTSMVMVQTKNYFPTEYIPTVFDNCTTNLIWKGKVCCLQIWDTAGQETYDRLRSLSYPDADVFLIVFSVVSPSSFHNVKKKWFPEVTWYSPGVPIVLVGSKIDARDDLERVRVSMGLEPKKRSEEHITTEEGEALARHLGAFSYVECSSLTKKGLDKVFIEIVKSFVETRSTPRKRKSCLVM